MMISVKTLQYCTDTKRKSCAQYKESPIQRDRQLWKKWLQIHQLERPGLWKESPLHQVWQHLGMDFFIYRRNCCQFFLVICPHEAGTWDPNYTLGVDFLDHDFYNLKHSSQDLSNEGSNFILSSLEVGHWVAQT